jgi:alpha-N-acetylglucosamine transferase
MREPGAFATLVTNPDYAQGALALARSLARVKTDFPLLVLATPGAGQGLEALEAAGCRIIEVGRLPLSANFAARHDRAAQHAAAPFTRGRKPGFHDPLDNFAKLRLWQLDGFERIVFLDADTIVIKPIDKLMGYPEFAAAPNLYESLADFHRLNSGVFVARPDPRTFDAMLARLDDGETFWRRTDQTFLEAFFADWHGLPWTMNALQYAYLNLPGLWHWPAIRVVHYQYEKPWALPHPKADALKPLIDLWWAVLVNRPFPPILQ